MWSLIVPAIVTIFTAFFSSSDETQKATLDFFKKYGVAFFSAIATVAAAFLDLFPLFIRAVKLLCQLVLSSTSEVTSFNMGDPFSGAPGYAYSALNTIVPVRETMSGLLIILTLYVSRLAVKVAKMIVWLASKIKSVVMPR